MTRSSRIESSTRSSSWESSLIQRLMEVPGRTESPSYGLEPFGVSCSTMSSFSTRTISGGGFGNSSAITTKTASTLASEIRQAAELLRIVPRHSRESSDCRVSEGFIIATRGANPRNSCEIRSALLEWRPRTYLENSHRLRSSPNLLNSQSIPVGGVSAPYGKNREFSRVNREMIPVIRESISEPGFLETSRPHNHRDSSRRGPTPAAPPLREIATSCDAGSLA